MTAVPFPTLGPNGFVAPLEIDILNGNLADFNAAFGGNLNLSLSTPQGQLATSISTVVGYGNDLFCYYVSQVDPAFSMGRMQDGIARIYFLSRNGPRPTAVELVCTGAAGTVIPAGSLALSLAGDTYQSTGDAIIPIGGSVTVPFAAVVDGPIPCPANTVTQISRAVPGWDSVNNPTDGVPGRDTEGRLDFETRRAASVAGNALGILPAVQGAVLSVADVLDAFVYENPTAAPVTYRGVTLPAHSLYVAVVGGTDADVARAIWTKKNPGCDYYGGNTTVTVSDTNGYAVPYPTYTVKFERPASLRIYVLVKIASTVGIPSNAEALVQAAVLNAFNGADGGNRARIGSTVFASRFYPGVAALGTWATIIEILVGTADPATADTVSVDIDQIPTLDGADITLDLV